MKKYLVILWLLLPFIGLAQQPQWTDYVWRTSNYPDQDYFMAFVSGEVPEGKNAKDLLDEYEEQAKATLIQQIQVSIQAATDYQLANIDAATTEAFKMSIENHGTIDV